MYLPVFAVFEDHEKLAGIRIIDDLLHSHYIRVINLLEDSNLLADPVNVNVTPGVKLTRSR